MQKKIMNQMIIFFLSGILGYFLITNMLHNTQQYSLVSINSIQMMKNSIQNNRQEIQDLREMIEQKKKELDNYKNAVKEKGSISTVLEQELEQLKMLSGTTDVHGPGIMIRLDDNHDGYKEGEDLNLYIVHDLDVVLIVNDLIAAGAEAISINGKRLTADSGIICGGNVIKINDEEIGAPFIIKAIGDPKLLSAAVNAPNTYGWELKEFFGIKLETIQSDDIPIPRYFKKPEFEYVKPINKEGE
ncbi:DUF881 domain-containing protein [Caldisalinibacter kiritimatiensis]|uniref:Division initiation protein n=1 Tax=Caldisalinibacter kiritimatiensis TaxID=1304284 RepID=R1CG24_9FIRM|nr:DUF881 domain-containing protein [Caldisalinibacter kiritimatiensis]EOD01265.1 Division initiation protein [Caldisalinibacter kiritimatiensis]